MAMDEDYMNCLVLDALYYRRATPGDSCFVSNIAGLDLLRCDASVLSRIEKVLRTLVAPRSDSQARKDFLGLDYVLGAYAIVGSRYDPARVVDFIRTLPAALQAEFVAALPIFFRRDDGEYSFDIPPASELLEFVDASRTAEVESLRRAASRASSLFGPPPTRTEETIVGPVTEKL